MIGLYIVIIGILIISIIIGNRIENIEKSMLAIAEAFNSMSVKLNELDEKEKAINNN